MKVSLRKIKSFLPTTLSANDISAVLTATGLEVEGVESVDDVPGGMRGLVVGHIISCIQHPNADRLQCCKVDIGADEVLEIVCGAPNAKKGLKVLVATVGATLHPIEGEPFKIKKGKIRGEVSKGMLCSEEEVGLGKSNGGIMELESDLKPGSLASDVFDLGTDDVLEIGLTPNRNDAMGHFGVARDLRAGLLHGTISHFVDTSLPPVALPKLLDSIDFTKSTKMGLDVQLEANSVVKKYALIAMDGVKVGPSPENVQRFLRAIGVTPINNIVDATNYVLHELGTPLHAFDYDKVSGGKFIIRLAKEGELITTLDGVERKLDPTDIVIADAIEAMCLAGVYGGSKHGVSDTTTRILIESAWFDPVSVRKTAKRHGLSTDASFRFERQVDPNMVSEAAKRAAYLISEWAGAETFAHNLLGEIDYTPGNTVHLEWDMLDNLIGQKLDRIRVKSILESLDISLETEIDGVLKLNVPAYRSDVTRPADVVEEILRIHGFDQIDIPLRISSTLEIPSKSNREDEIFGWASTLVARGFNEIISNSLTKPIYSQSVNDPDIDSEANVKILNPLSGDLSVMRQSLVFQGLEAIARNRNHRMSDLRFFELGRTYKKTSGEYKETEHLSIWVTGRKRQENWNEGSENVDVFNVKEAVSAILDQVGIRSQVKEAIDDGGLLLEGNSIIIGENIIGRFGQLHPEVTALCDIEQPVFWADLLVKPLLKSRVKKAIKAVILPKFPSVRRDLSLILDKDTSFEEIKRVAFSAERKLLTNVSLFDVYEGDKIEKGKMSYAISLTLQDASKTLTDKHIDKSVARILEAVTKETGATLR